MSKPVTLRTLKILSPATGALPAKYTMFLSDGTKHDVLGSFTDKPDQIAVQVANALLDLNQVAYWHPISKGHVQALIKFKRAVIAKGLNSVHTSDDMNGTENELTKPEYANWTMLRFHALVAKHHDAGAGYWLLTTKGNEFLRGERAIAKRVKTENNVVVDHDELHVSVDDVYGSMPYFPRKEEIEMEPPVRRELVQAGLGL